MSNTKETAFPFFCTGTESVPNEIPASARTTQIPQMNLKKVLLQKQAEILKEPFLNSKTFPQIFFLKRIYRATTNKSAKTKGIKR